MKKIALCLMATCLLLTFLPPQSNAATTDETSSVVVSKPAETVESAEAAEAQALLMRLNEIKAMDKANLTSSEKKDLRKEVLSIRESLYTIGGGVYISAAAVLIILVILLIVLL
jgi:hypothetical protein